MKRIKLKKVICCFHSLISDVDEVFIELIKCVQFVEQLNRLVDFIPNDSFFSNMGCIFAQINMKAVGDFTFETL